MSCVLAATIALAAGPTVAQSGQAGAALTVQQRVSVSATRQLVQHGSGRGTASAPGALMITGDAGRAYRVTLPEPDATAFVVISDTAGDISVTRTGRLNAAGQDRLRVLGRLPGEPATFLDLTAGLPISIDYE